MAEAAIAVARGIPTAAGPVDLELRRGDIVHVRGGNGSGKTSLLRSLAGLDAPVRPAAVELLGRDPRSVPAPELARGVRAAWATAASGLVGLTVEGEARLRGTRLPPSLAALAGRDVATLSTGEARQVALALLQANPAPLLLLDEPASGLDRAGLAVLDALVQQAARAGAVVVADHTGWAGRHATRTLDLGAPAPAPVAAMPRPDAGARLTAPSAVVQRGRGQVRLPAVDLGPGLHAVTGRNGAGKSTLLRRLAGLHHAQAVLVDGQPPRPGDTVRFLQADAGSLLMRDLVRDELAGTGGADGLVRDELLARHPLSLSSGEGHRVALAKALRPAPVHLLDEPEAHLDADGRARLLQALARRIEAGACIVAATHDAQLIAAARSRIEVAP